MNTKSRFKYFLIDPEELPTEAKSVRPVLEKLFLAFDEREISISEFLFLAIALFCEKRRPQEWWMKGAGPYRVSGPRRVLFGELLRELGFAHPCSSLTEFFSAYRIKNLPVAVPFILYVLSTNDERLVVSEEPVTPLEMLRIQASGRRILTVSRRCLLSGQLVDGKRDAVEFLLHDMAHAHLFFSETHEEQKTFFKALLKDVEASPHLLTAITDTTFKAALEYIMSDMNSSLPHLQQSLQAALIDKARREKEVAEGETLSVETEGQLFRQWSATGV